MYDSNQAEDSIFKQENRLVFMKLEADYLKHVKQQDIQVDPSLGVDVVIAWQMNKGNSQKQGFICFFGLKVMSN